MAEPEVEDTFSGLPSEILAEIFSHLPRNIPSLINVTLVSRKFLGLVQPFMYRSINFNFSPPIGSGNYFAQRAGEFCNLTDALARSPTLCSVSKHRPSPFSSKSDPFDYLNGQSDWYLVSQTPNWYCKALWNQSLRTLYLLFPSLIDQG